MKKILILAIVLATITTMTFLPKKTSVTTREISKEDQSAINHSPDLGKTIIDDRADRINEYFKKRNMPLFGYGQKFVEEADKNGIDWRLLPAISVKESSGGKHMCKNNPFGWASCRVQFASLDEAIMTVARNLGGNNPNTHAYYKGDTRAKLWSYNGTVEALYPQRVIDIMESF